MTKLEIQAAGGDTATPLNLQNASTGSVPLRDPCAARA